MKDPGERRMDALKRYCESAFQVPPELWREHCLRHRHGEMMVELPFLDKRLPTLFAVSPNGKPGAPFFKPYFRVNEHRDRQIVSYMLGRTLCNLAEIMEFSSSLYSRWCGSYGADELVHSSPVESRLALWIHDCLTEDFDHSGSLNRYYLTGGACLSFDLGMAFSNKYFPPFYSMELGIDDTDIVDNAPFVLAQLVRYAELTKHDEAGFMQSVRARYPSTRRADHCRYYLRCFKAQFPVRLYYGRFFQGLAKAPFARKEMEPLFNLLDIPVGNVYNWSSAAQRLVQVAAGRLDLRGLDLSGMDLRRADLKGADLREANLADANMERADLRNADLRGARMDGAGIKNARTEGVRADDEGLFVQATARGGCP